MSISSRIVTTATSRIAMNPQTPGVMRFVLPVYAGYGDGDGAARGRARGLTPAP
jgi:hypothetical protein